MYGTVLVVGVLRDSGGHKSAHILRNNEGSSKTGGKGGPSLKDQSALLRHRLNLPHEEGQPAHLISNKAFSKGFCKRNLPLDLIMLVTVNHL